MLAKEFRLNLKKDFKWVASGKRIETKFLKMFVKVGDNQNARVGIATASSAFRKAHERNRARRLTSSAFESIYTKLPKGINIVVLPKAGIEMLKSGDLSVELAEGLKLAKII